VAQEELAGTPRLATELRDARRDVDVQIGVGAEQTLDEIEVLGGAATWAARNVVCGWAAARFPSASTSLRW
jgi:hypothetical protein